MTYTERYWEPVSERFTKSVNQDLRLQELSSYKDNRNNISVGPNNSYDALIEN